MTQEQCVVCQQPADTELDLNGEKTPSCYNHQKQILEQPEKYKNQETETSGDRPVLTQPGDDEGAAWLNTDKNGKVYLSVKIEDDYHNFYPQYPLLQWAFNALHKVTQQ